MIQKRCNVAFHSVRKFVAPSGTRTFSGIASTPKSDRVGDIVEPMGAEFDLPVPLLLFHDHSRPCGWVRAATPTASGIKVRCEIADGIPDADLAWQMVETKLLSSLSIGFKPVESEPLRDGGWRFKRWMWLELSIVSVPANADARITGKKYPGDSVKLLPPLPRGAVRLSRGRR